MPTLVWVSRVAPLAKPRLSNASHTFNTGSGTVLTRTVDIRAGDLVVVVSKHEDTAITIPTITDSLGNVYQSVAAFAGASAPNTAYTYMHWCKSVGNALGATVTQTFGTARAFRVMGVFVFSAISGNWKFNAARTSSGDFSQRADPARVRRSSGGVAVAICGVYAGATWTDPPRWLRGSNTGNDWVGYTLLNGSEGAVQPRFDYTTGSALRAIVVGTWTLDDVVPWPITAAADGAIASTGAIAVAGSGALTAIGTVAATTALTVAGSGALTAQGTLAATTAITVAGAADLQAAGGNALASTGAITLAGSAAATARGTLAASTSVTVAGSAATTATGALASSQAITIAGSAAATARGTLAASTSVTIDGSAGLVAGGSSALASTGAITVAGSANATARGTLAATTAITVAGSAGVTAIGTVAATTALTLAGSAVATARGTLDATTAITIAGSAAISAAGGFVLASTGAITFSGSAAITARGTLASTGAIAIGGTANGYGALNAAATTAISLGGSALLRGAGVLVTTAPITVAGSAAVTARGTLASVGLVQFAITTNLLDGNAGTLPPIDLPGVVSISKRRSVASGSTVRGTSSSRIVRSISSTHD